MKALLKKKSGYTLLEVIIVLAILGILMGGMLFFFRPIIQMLNTVTKDVRGESVATICEDYLTKKLQYAKNIVIIQDVPYNKLGTESSIQNELQILGNVYKQDDSNLEIGCVSIRKQAYKMTTNQYWNVLCEEKFNVASDGSINMTSGSTVLDSIKVFNDAFYCNVYLDFDFADGTGSTGNSKFSVLRTKVYCFDDPDESISVYANEKDKINASIMNTTAFTTLLNLRINKDITGYNSQFVAYNNAIDSLKDCGTYIFYVTRKLKTP